MACTTPEGIRVIPAGCIRDCFLRNQILNIYFFDEIIDASDYALVHSNEGMVDLLTEDINATVSFLDKECSEEQFVWMSEIFDEIAERTKSKAFIEALRRAARRYQKATEDYNIEYFIDSAEEYTD